MFLYGEPLWQSVDGHAMSAGDYGPCTVAVLLAPLAVYSHACKRRERGPPRAPGLRDAHHREGCLLMVPAPGAERARTLAMLFRA